MEKEIKVLELLNENNGARQQDIARRADISIGLVNSIIKGLVQDEYINKRLVARKPYYDLTPKGISTLETYLELVRKVKINLHSLEFKPVKQAIILAAGGTADFEKPVGCLEIENTTILERTLDILRRNNIDDIVIITGFKHEIISEIISEKPKIHAVENKGWNWSGTMQSLSLAREHVDDDFLLIESDLLFENKAISHLISDTKRDSIIITNLSGSEDEVLVEIKNGYLYNMSKDIHQLNKIDGEMIGISKISYSVYCKMLEEYQTNENPYLNYEYLLLDMARTYNIGILKMEDLVWAEVDNSTHYERAKKIIYPKIKLKDKNTTE